MGQRCSEKASQRYAASTRRPVADHIGFVRAIRVGGNNGALPRFERFDRNEGATMHFSINGVDRDLDVDIRTSLLDLLRDHLDLTGTKKGCNQGACGACTVLVDGERINSCLALAVQYQGRAITTIEGIGLPGDLAALQTAFVEHDGFQCGYCTPGQICSGVAMAAEAKRGLPSFVTADLAAEKVTLDHDELRERMSGNLCRCGAYNGIIDAMRDVFAEEAA